MEGVTKLRKGDENFINIIIYIVYIINVIHQNKKKVYLWKRWDLLCGPIHEYTLWLWYPSHCSLKTFTLPEELPSEVESVFFSISDM